MIHYIATDGIANVWVANELRELQRFGIPYHLHAMRLPPEEKVMHVSGWAKEIESQTSGIYPLSVWSLAVALLCGPFRFGRRFWEALFNALFSPKETWRAYFACVAHFGVACWWANELRGASVSHIHSQWIHSCGTIAMYGAWLTGTTYSFTGHATDLFRDRVALRDKVRRADMIVCISEFHRDFFLQEGADADKLQVVYCGIDPTVFVTRPREAYRAVGPYRIRSSGRLVEKKGFRYLIDACRLLHDRGVDFECLIAGSGPLEEELQRQVEELGLASRLTITGKPIMQEEIAGFMHGGDVYCLPCVWAADNDVDGLPQMLMEAMACGLPVVSTRLVGIPDLVRHEETGLLVEPNDVPQLADALDRMRQDAELSQRLGAAGNELVREDFDIRNCLHPLLNYYSGKLSSGTTPSQLCVEENVASTAVS